MNIKYFKINHGYEPQSKLWILYRKLAAGIIPMPKQDNSLYDFPSTMFRKIKGSLPSAARDCSTYQSRSAAHTELEFHNKKHPAGFSAIEIISVILIIAVVGVVGISRYMSTTSYKVASETEILKANLRYAQFRALSAADTAYGVNNTTWGILLSANSYTLQKDGASATTKLPGENTSTHTLPAGSVITTGAGTAITYNLWGTPVDAAGIPLTGNTTINVSDGISSRTITVTQNTGFIP